MLGVVLPFLGPFLEHRGLGAVAVGLVTAAFSLAKLMYSPVLGRWVDRGGWLPGMLSLHMIIAVAAALVVTLTDDPWLLGGAFLAVGLGFGTVLPLVEAAVLERPPVRGYGFVRWWGSAGFVGFSVVTATVLAGDRLERFPWTLIAALAVLTAISVSLERESKPHREGDTRARLRGVVWPLLVVLTLNQAAHGPYYAFFSIHLSEHGYGTGLVAGLWSFAVLAELVLFIRGGRLEQRFGLERLLGIALVVSPLRWLLLALPPSLPVLVVAQAGHAVTFAAAHLAGVQLVQRVVPAGARRNAQALYSGLAFGLGIVVGTAAAGPLYGSVGGSGSFLVAAGVSVVVAVLWTLVSSRIANTGTDAGTDADSETRR